MHQYIGGALATGTAARTAAVVDPSTGENVHTVAPAGPEETDAAVAAATAALGDWSRAGPAERTRVLARAGALLGERAEVFARAEARQTGMPVRLARAGDVPAAVAAALGAAAARPPGRGEEERHEPAGVVAVLVPRTRPLRAAADSVFAALAAGCAVVLKPAVAAPLTAVMLARLLTEAGLPAGGLNVVTGTGPVAGAHLVRHPGVAQVSFTGSPAGAREVAAGAGGRKRLTLDSGRRGPFVVHRDADLAVAVPGVVAAALLHGGQDAAAGARAVVHRSLVADFVDGAAERFAAVRVGPPQDEGTQLGPLASFSRRHRVAALVERARRYADVVTGGCAPGRSLAAGAYYRPTLVTGAGADSEIVRAAVPGPVLAVLPFDTDEEAVRLANAVPEATAASVWTRDLGRARRAAGELRADRVGVNVHPYDAGPVAPVTFTRVKQVRYGDGGDGHAADPGRLFFAT
ncbi:aldehyde dehydrogenase family protein [Streptomyces marincola]|nr:aldehyde dehydrogenase family protein [Streptomyces marincola]